LEGKGVRRTMTIPWEWDNGSKGGDNVFEVCRFLCNRFRKDAEFYYSTYDRHYQFGKECVEMVKEDDHRLGGIDEVRLLF
jgi:hypothetical protein